MNFNSSHEFQLRADSWNSSQNADLVFFNVDAMELFGVTLDYPGLKGALNKALEAGRVVTPIDTGLMRRSMTMRQLNDHMVVVFYDPNKIIGAIRKGVKVKEYYPKYLDMHHKTFNFLSIVIKHFYDKLFAEVKLLKKKEPAKPAQEPVPAENANTKKVEDSSKINMPQTTNTIIQSKTSNNLLRSFIDLTTGLLFMQTLNREYKEKKELARKMQEEQKQKQLNQIATAEALAALRKAQTVRES